MISPTVRQWYQEQAEIYGECARHNAGEPWSRGPDIVNCRLFRELDAFEFTRKAAHYANLVLFLERSGCESLEELETDMNNLRRHQEL